jgi:predicted DCC family thiol-disulfide oxidoreductase YuxK
MTKSGEPATMSTDAGTMQPIDSAEILLVYDRECPVCDAYCRMVRIRESVGALRLVNARDADGIMDEITAKGLDIDEGMVLKFGNSLYYGADAIHVLSLMSSRSGVFNRLTYWIFRSKGLSTMLYPLFRFFRNLLLKLLRKSRINNLGLPRRERF